MPTRHIIPIIPFYEQQWFWGVILGFVPSIIIVTIKSWWDYRKSIKLKKMDIFYYEKYKAYRILYKFYTMAYSDALTLISCREYGFLGFDKLMKNHYYNADAGKYNTKEYYLYLDKDIKKLLNELEGQYHDMSYNISDDSRKHFKDFLKDRFYLLIKELGELVESKYIV